MGPIQSISDVISMLRRRVVPFTLVACIGIVFSLMHALSQASLYEAASLIQLRNTGLNSDDALTSARRVQVIEQRLMRRENVHELVEKHGLFRNQPALTEDDKLFLFRQQNRIQMIDATGGGGTGASVSALLITSQAGSPEQAAQVANDLAQSLMAQDVAERTRTTVGLVTFLGGEARRLNQHLEAIDKQIGEVKNANEEALPEANEALRSESAQLRELQLELDRQILELERDEFLAEQRPAAEGTTDADTSLASRLLRLNSELAQTRRLLSADHPEVRRIEAEIQALQNSTGERKSSSEREMELIASQRRTIETQKAVIATRQAEIENSLERTPLVEQQLAGLARTQEQLVAQLSDVSLQLARAQSQQTIQDTDAAEGMVLLEEARPPVYAMSSSRKRLLAMGGMASFGAAALLIFLLELLNPVIRSAAAMERRVGVVPIVTVPMLGTPEERSRQIRRFAIAAAIFVVTIVYCTYLYVTRDSDTEEVTVSAPE